MGTWLVSEKIQKKTKRKQRLSLGLGATKPIDHTRARMVSRLAEIQAKEMRCMSITADTLNHQDPLFQGHGSQLKEMSRTPICQVFTDCAKGGGVRHILPTPGPARGTVCWKTVSTIVWKLFGCSDRALGLALKFGAGNVRVVRDRIWHLCQGHINLTELLPGNNTFVFSIAWLVYFQFKYAWHFALINPDLQQRKLWNSNSNIQATMAF